MNLEKGCLFLRALSADEVAVSSSCNTPLDHLGRNLAHALKGNYTPQCLTKIRKTEKTKLLSRSERETELLNVYSFELPPEIEINTLFILDDIFTSGTTMCSIIDAIRKVRYKSSIILFTLALTDRQALLNKTLRLNSSAYQWGAAQGWTTVGENQEAYLSLAQLKVKILNDFT